MQFWSVTGKSVSDSRKCIQHKVLSTCRVSVFVQDTDLKASDFKAEQMNI